MAAKNLEDLFVDGLKDIYDAEKRITKALPKMKRAASSEELKAAFDEHLQQTEGQIGRIEQIFEELGKPARAKVCDAMVGLLREGDKHMEEVEEGPAGDASLIASAQKVEHYEIATYGTLRDWAEKLGHDSIVKLLQQTLEEETETDERLTEIAQSINVDAEDEEGEEEEGEMTASSSRRSTSPRTAAASGSRSKKATSRSR